MICVRSTGSTRLGFSTNQSGALYHQAGVAGLALGYQGSKPYLTAEQRATVVAWIQVQEGITVEALRDYMQAEQGVSYLSKQSYYDLLSESGLSYHRTTPANPKRDEDQINERREELKKSGAARR